MKEKTNELLNQFLTQTAKSNLDRVKIVRSRFRRTTGIAMFFASIALVTCIIFKNIFCIPMMRDAQLTFNNLVPPKDIDNIYCVYGINVETPSQMVYYPKSWFRSPFPDQNPTVIYGEGDGTIPLRSLEICKQWTNVQHKILPGAEHTQILNDPRFIDILKELNVLK